MKLTRILEMPILSNPNCQEFRKKLVQHTEYDTKIILSFRSDMYLERKFETVIFNP